MNHAFAGLVAAGCLLSSLLTAAEPAVAPHPLKLAQAGSTLLTDDYQQSERPKRRLTRGNWTVKNGEASCAHDEELFKKFKDHGPAVWYDQEFTDGVIRFQFQPSPECQHFVFTINGSEGHVFRFVMNHKATDIRAWDADHKGKQLAANGPALPEGGWIPVTVEIVGQQACVQIGDKYQAVVEDASYAAPKTVVGVSFHYGTVRLRNFEIVQAKAK